MRIIRNEMPINELAELEYAKALAASEKAVQDYNIMLGILEDPSEDEEAEEESYGRA